MSRPLGWCDDRTEPGQRKERIVPVVVEHDELSQVLLLELSAASK
jgi:hypothetical protein